MPFQPFVRFLDTNGDGTGSTNGVGNFSGAPVDFFFQTPPNSIVSISSYSVNLSDKAANISLDKYGDLPALTNGVSLITTISGVVTTRFSGVKTNSNLMTQFSDIFLFHEQQDFFLKFRVTFPENSGDFLRLNQAGDRFTIRLNDDFSGLDRHQFIIRGLMGT